MRSFVFVGVLTVLFSGCTIELPPIGEDVSCCQTNDQSTRVYFDARNDIFWASILPGPGATVMIYPAGEGRYLYRFNLGGNDTRFGRMVINPDDEFLVVINQESLLVVMDDTSLLDFYRVQLPEAVVDFDLKMGRIYYHNIHQEKVDVRITDLDGGVLLVDERGLRCYESRMSRITNLVRGKEYGLKIMINGDTERYIIIRLE